MPDKSTVITGTETSSDTIRDNAVGLFRYLRGLAELRQNVRDVTSYELTFWFSELPSEKECYTPAWNGEELPTKRTGCGSTSLSDQSCPERPLIVNTGSTRRNWTTFHREPKLYDEIVDPKWISSDREDGDDSDSTPPPNLLLSDHPHVFSAWEEYLERKWRPCEHSISDGSRCNGRTGSSLRFTRNNNDGVSNTNCCWGLACFCGLPPSEHEVRRPVVTHTCDDFPRTCLWPDHRCFRSRWSKFRG